MLSYFNSIKVQLEQVCLNVLSTLSALFQFHKGTIRTCIPSRTLYVKLYFNSIKVQLEPQGLLRTTLAIRFQFHKGTIRTLGYSISKGSVFYFNSIKVQLELISRSVFCCMNKHISIP